MYKELYFYLFNRITDAIENIEKENTKAALEILINAQQTSENYYIDFGKSTSALSPNN